jgi:RNA polymerase sigma factor (sigma-70 family)
MLYQGTGEDILMNCVITPDLLSEISRMSQYLCAKNGYAMHPYDSDDLAQEVCLKVLGKYDGKRPVKNFIWFYGNRIISDMYRKLHGRYANVKYQEIDETAVGADEIEKIDLRLSLDAVTRRAKPNDREIIHRYFIGGETGEELAARFGLSPGRISQIVHNTYNGGWL